MTTSPVQPGTQPPATAFDAADPATWPPIPDRSLPRALLKLARPTQWAKSVFCFIGPFYGMAALTVGGMTTLQVAMSALAAAVAFALASSGCYVINDLADRDADRHHPRKRCRPIAAGQVSPKLAVAYAIGLFAVAFATPAIALPWAHAQWVTLAVVVHVVNVLAYSAGLKHIAIVDVISLAMGFVLRMMGGCAAVGIEPTVWLLNVTFFLSMFLAFGKRLGERRTLAASGGAAAHRRVQGDYTDAMLQMAVVVTAVMTLVTYALYVQAQAEAPTVGFNLLWLTLLPATYGLLRCIIVIEAGRYDDPTELALHDRGFQIAAGLFAAITVAIALWRGDAGTADAARPEPPAAADGEAAEGASRLREAASSGSR
jgi:4-hydroxybenzoate polyprenyltransferase